jgi:hypothetical protein
MKGAGRWIAETRAGRLLFGAGCLLLVGVVVYVFVNEEVGRQTKEITKRVQVIESADPCVALSQAAEDDAGRKVMRRLTRACTRFLDGLGALISQRLACDILESGAYPCPRPGSTAAIQQHEGGDASQPAEAGQPSKPPAGGDTGGSPPRGDKAPATDEPDSTDPPPAAAAPSETPADPPPPPPAAPPESSSSPVDEIEDTVKSVIGAVCDLTDRLQHRC